MSARVALYVVLAGAVLALVFYATGQITGRLDAADRAAIAADRAFVQGVHARQRERARLLARVDSAKAVAAHWRQVAGQHLAAADTASQTADSAAGAAAWEAAYQARTVEAMQLRAALAAKTSEAVGLEAALDSTRAALAAAAGDIDSLTVRLDASNRRAECRILGMRICPSRTVVGIAGFVVGAVAVSAASTAH